MYFHILIIAEMFATYKFQSESKQINKQNNSIGKLFDYQIILNEWFFRHVILSVLCVGMEINLLTKIIYA